MAKDAPQQVSAATPQTAVQSQKQSGSAEPDYKEATAPDKGKNKDEIQFFDTTFAKLVERKDEQTGKTEWVEVMSDNLYPGEKLKSEVDAEEAQTRADRLNARNREAAQDRRDHEDSLVKKHRTADERKSGVDAKTDDTSK